MSKFKKNPIGYFNLLLGVDCETSSISLDDTLRPAANCQAVSWGFIVINANTLEIIDELYIEVKWNGESEWSAEAEKVHGLSKEYLDKHGVEEKEALLLISEFLFKYWTYTVSINTLGHNSISFDMDFLNDLYNKYDLRLKFSHRNVDSFTPFFLLLNIYNSVDGFTALGMPHRTYHNALDDIKYTLECLRRIRVIWREKIGLVANYDEYGNMLGF